MYRVSSFIAGNRASHRRAPHAPSIRRSVRTARATAARCHVGAFVHSAAAEHGSLLSGGRRDARLSSFGGAALIRELYALLSFTLCDLLLLVFSLFSRFCYVHCVQQTRRTRRKTFLRSRSRRVISSTSMTTLLRGARSSWRLRRRRANKRFLQALLLLTAVGKFP